MPEKAGKEILNVAEGAAIVEAADAPVIQSAFEELQQAMGSDIDFTPAETSRLGEMTGHIVDTAQGLVLPVATALIMWAGLKKMAEGIRRQGR